MNLVPERQPVRVMLLGFGKGVADALARYLGGDPRVEFVGVARDVAAARALLPRARPEMLIVEWCAFDGWPREVATLLRGAWPAVRIVAAASEREAYAAAAVRAGVDCVISNDAIAGELEFLLSGYFPERCGEAGGRDA